MSVLPSTLSGRSFSRSGSSWGTTSFWLGEGRGDGVRAAGVGVPGAGAGLPGDASAWAGAVAPADPQAATASTRQARTARAATGIDLIGRHHAKTGGC